MHKLLPQNHSYYYNSKAQKWKTITIFLFSKKKKKAQVANGDDQNTKRQFFDHNQ